MFDQVQLLRGSVSCYSVSLYIRFKQENITVVAPPTVRLNHRRAVSPCQITPACTALIGWFFFYSIARAAGYLSGAGLD